MRYMKIGVVGIGISEERIARIARGGLIFPLNEIIKIAGIESVMGETSRRVLEGVAGWALYLKQKKEWDLSVILRNGNILGGCLWNNGVTYSPLSCIGFAHSLGHCLGLDHPQQIEDEDNRNIMHRDNNTSGTNLMIGDYYFTPQDIEMIYYKKPVKVKRVRNLNGRVLVKR